MPASRTIRWRGFVLASTPRAAHVMIQGRFVVRDGCLVTQDEDQIAERHRSLVARIVQ